MDVVRILGPVGDGFSEKWLEISRDKNFCFAEAPFFVFFNSSALDGFVPVTLELKYGGFERGERFKAGTFEFRSSIFKD